MATDWLPQRAEVAEERRRLTGQYGHELYQNLNTPFWFLMWIDFLMGFGNFNGWNKNYFLYSVKRENALHRTIDRGAQRERVIEICVLSNIIAVQIITNLAVGF